MFDCAKHLIFLNTRNVKFPLVVVFNIDVGLVLVTFYRHC